MVKKTFFSLCLCNASLSKPWRPSHLFHPLSIFIGRDTTVRDCGAILRCRHRDCAAGSRRREVILFGASIILPANISISVCMEQKWMSVQYRWQSLHLGVSFLCGNQVINARRSFHQRCLRVKILKSKDNLQTEPAQLFLQVMH